MSEKVGFHSRGQPANGRGMNRPEELFRPPRSCSFACHSPAAPAAPPYLRLRRPALMPDKADEGSDGIRVATMGRAKAPGATIAMTSGLADQMALGRNSRERRPAAFTDRRAERHAHQHRQRLQ